MQKIEPFYVPASDPEIFEFKKVLNTVPPVTTDTRYNNYNFYGVNERGRSFFTDAEPSFDHLTARQGIARLRGTQYEIGKEYEFSDDGTEWHKGELLSIKNNKYWRIDPSNLIVSHSYPHIRPIKPSVRELVIAAMKDHCPALLNRDILADRIIQIVKGEKE